MKFTSPACGLWAWDESHQHGLEAAVLMGRVRDVIRTAAVEEADPGRVLQFANAAIELMENLEAVYADTPVAEFIAKLRADVEADATHDAWEMRRSAGAP